MRILPIFWTQKPSAEDWGRLSAAREALGYTELIKPVQALPGSPGALLVIGSGRPDWLHNFYACNDIANEAELQSALKGALSEDQRLEAFTELLSQWMHAGVTFVGEEQYDEPVGFGT